MMVRLQMKGLLLLDRLVRDPTAERSWRDALLLWRKT